MLLTSYHLQTPFLTGDLTPLYTRKGGTVMCEETLSHYYKQQSMETVYSSGSQTGCSSCMTAAPRIFINRFAANERVTK
jgi:hypothetical protein